MYACRDIMPRITLVFITDQDSNFEYFCQDCGQIRLSIKGNKEFSGCGNCGSFNAVIGPVDSLDVGILKQQHAVRKDRIK